MTRLNDLFEKYWPEVKDFIYWTWVDYKNAWNDYPNVLIWCGLFFILALLF